MRRSLYIWLKVFAFWLLFFTLAKILFLLINASSTADLGITTTFGVFLNGFKLDLSMSGYCTLLMMVLSLLTSFLYSKIFTRVFNVTGYFLIFSLALLSIVDARLYHYWGFKLDLTAFGFLSTPKEAAASVQTSDLVVFVVAYIAFVFSSLSVFKRVFRNIKPVQRHWKTIGVNLVLAGVVLLPIRGGTGVATIGLSSAYFSSNSFANHAAVNTTWNLMYSYLNQDNSLKKLKEFKTAQHPDIGKELFAKGKGNMPTINNGQPINVVMIVLESFSAGLIENLGGIDGVTPNLNRLSQEKWSFTNFYSSGDRSDKGLSSLFTGTPGLPESSVLRFPDKLNGLPHMYTHFERSGYHTSILYGGNLDFANLRSLFTVVEECDIVEKSSIETGPNVEKGKWGIHDQHTFSYLEKHIKAIPEPFFTTLYTLSSHEPFDVPSTSRVFEGKDAKCLTAAWYTDSCLGAFLKAIEASDVWDRTLVVITADHAIRHPGSLPVYHPEKFHIPLIFTGGVIKNNTVFDIFGSHTDLPYTLQKWLLKVDDAEMKFSKSLFDTTSSYANFFYQIGSGMIDSSGCVVYDFHVDKVIYKDVESDLNEERLKTSTRYYSSEAAREFDKLQAKRSPALKEQGK